MAFYLKIEKFGRLTLRLHEIVCVLRRVWTEVLNSVAGKNV